MHAEILAPFSSRVLLAGFYAGLTFVQNSVRAF